MSDDKARDRERETEIEIEDYGSPATGGDVGQGSYSGGTEGTQQGSGEGEQFGEFDNTGAGVDLTIEMENTDVRSGLVKGGQQGADDVVGPGAYGGDAGSLSNRENT
jgi:hypothetical protein